MKWMYRSGSKHSGGMKDHLARWSSLKKMVAYSLLAHGILPCPLFLLLPTVLFDAPYLLLNHVHPSFPFPYHIQITEIIGQCSTNQSTTLVTLTTIVLFLNHHLFQWSLSSLEFMQPFSNLRALSMMKIPYWQKPTNLTNNYGLRYVNHAALPLLHSFAVQNFAHKFLECIA